MSKFHGLYADLLDQYISFKRSMGYKFTDAESVYGRFDRFTVELGESEIGIKKELADQWAQKRPNETDSTCYRRVLYLIHFILFIKDMGYPSYIPKLPRSYKSTFTPHIFSKEEINSIFQACDILESYHSMNSSDFAMPALLRMLYGTGIRIGEALTLRVKDVDFNDNYLTIHQSKNGKERMIPFSETLSEVCQQYRNSLKISCQIDDFFFVKQNGYGCTSKAIYNYFRKILWIAGISHGGRGLGPRIHDFRHTFSVHTLAKMSEQGLDLYYSLPILSEYLGHQSLEATEKYVRLTSEMYPGMLLEVNSICSYVFPELINDENN